MISPVVCQFQDVSLGAANQTEQERLVLVPSLRAVAALLAACCRSSLLLSGSSLWTIDSFHREKVQASIGLRFLTCLLDYSRDVL
jgi:hypothetical protein